MANRTTKTQLVNEFKRLCKAMGREPVTDYNNAKPGQLLLEYASEYGGYVIREKLVDGGESEPFGGTRRSATEMWETMYFAIAAIDAMKKQPEPKQPERPNFFYFSVPKRVEDMNHEELEREIDSAEILFRHYEGSGQGISSKEVVRHRDCQDKMVEMLTKSGLR